jgi:hypothetical protein|tara:strand:- start:26 stop:265 length:240 start_codon:yes stop_codon:yes gene_type:complete
MILNIPYSAKYLQIYVKYHPMKSKKIKLQRAKKLKSEMPSAVDDAADVMSKYSSKKNKVLLEDKKFSFPPIDYEKPPHF